MKAPRANIGNLHKTTLTASTVLAALGVANGSTLLLIAAVLLAGSLVLGAKRLLDTLHGKAKKRTIHGLTVAILIFAIVTFPRTRFDAVLLVVMAGIFNRFHLRGGQRDDFLIAGASAVLITAATTVMPGLTFLFVLLAYLPALLWSLWSAMILGGAETNEIDPRRKSAAVHHMAEQPIARGLGFIAWSGILLMAVSFVVVSAFPRYQLSQMLSAGYFMPLPGAGDTMELRTNGAIDIDDSTVMLRVEPPLGQKENALAGLYARLYVLDKFDGKGFTSSKTAMMYPIDRRPPQAFVDDRPELSPEDTPGTVRVTLNRLTRDALHPIATLGRSAPSEVIKRRLQQTLSGTWTAGHMIVPSIAYKVRLDQSVTVSPLPARAQNERDQILSEVPDTLDPRVVDLGRSLAKDAPTTKAKIDAILRFFGHGFRYSLDPLPGDSADPLVRFLFEAKQGHCELYAGALAVLLRVAGVKSRVATGYYGGRWNSVGGYLAFTQQDAHAWVEVLDDDGRWSWIDATPPEERAYRRRSTLDFIRDVYGAAEAFWFDNIIDFDERKRKLLVARLEDRYQAVKAAIFSRDAESGEGGSKGGGRASSAAVLSSLVILSSLAGGGLLVRRRRARAPEAIGLRLRTILCAEQNENVTLSRLVVRVPETVRSDARLAIARYEAFRFGPEDEAPPVPRVLEAMKQFERALVRARKRR
jgi:transglutaminase-like putative cysteine protease